jgi:hypothetical protein
MFIEVPSLNDTHDSHLLQASVFEEILVQLIVFASKRAVVVLPTPLGPVNRKA